MAIHTIEELGKRVMARMDEAMPKPTQVGVNINDYPIENMEQELDASALMIAQVGDIDVLADLVKTASDNATTIMRYQDGSGVITLPSDYVRFVYLLLSDWKRPLTALISKHQPEYKAQLNKHLRATIYKPVGVLMKHNGRQAIEYYVTTDKKPKIKELQYIPSIKAVDVPYSLLDPLIWFTVSRAFNTLRYVNEAKYANEQAMFLLTATKKGYQQEYEQRK